MAVNLAVIMGRLVADPELRHTQNDTPVTNFTVAVDRTYKSGDERQTDFIDVVAWRNTAEFVCKYFAKGQMIIIKGAIQTRTYEDKDGNKRKATEIVADNVFFGEPKRSEDTAEKTPPSIDPENGKDFRPRDQSLQDWKAEKRAQLSLHSDYSDYSVSDDDLPF